MRALFSFLCFISASAVAEETTPRIDWAAAQPHWVAPFEPFRLIGNVYYVGTEGIAVYLITGENGHALIDGGMPGYEHLIIENIAKLGFDIKDVKYLLNTHAHFDHSGGLAALKEASGAELMASEGDVSALEGGFYLGFEDDPNYMSPPVKVDSTFDRSGGVVELEDDVVLRGVITPGHSRGCTSWSYTFEDDGKPYDVLFFCSATVGGNSLAPEQYEGIVSDYRLTFEKTKNWNPDVFLSNHPEVFFLKETREKQQAGDPLAFVNPGAFQKYIAAKERAFERALAKQKEKIAEFP